MIDDAALLRAYAGNRSETAFAEFVGRRIGFVYVAALRQVAGDAQMAEDVTQAVFVLAAKRAAVLARHERVAGWLHTTTRNTANHAWRDMRRRDVREREAARMSEMLRDDVVSAADEADADASGAAGMGGAAGGGEAERLRPMLDEALGALREGEREAVLLRFFEGRGFGEIGARFRMSEDAAWMRVSRSLEKMRGSLARKGVTSSAAALSALMTAEAAQGAPAGLAASVSAGAVAAAAAASANAGVVGAILAFMSSAKIITTAAIAVILVAAGSVYFGVQNERVSVASLAQARLESKNLAEQVRTLEKQNAAASAPKITPQDLGNMFMDAHPEIREGLRANSKANAAYLTFQIAKALNLSPEQSEQLTELYGHIFGGFGFPVPGYGMVAFSPWEGEDSGVTKDQQRALLGDANYEKAQHLLDLTGSKTSLQSRELSTRLYLTDTPLTSQQALGIDEISYDIDKNLPKDTTPDARWKLFQERAKSVLSPEQMQALSDVGDGYIYKQTLSQEQHDYVEDAAWRAADRAKSK